MMQEAGNAFNDEVLFGVRWLEIECSHTVTRRYVVGVSNRMGACAPVPCIDNPRDSSCALPPPPFAQQPIHRFPPIAMSSSAPDTIERSNTKDEFIDGTVDLLSDADDPDSSKRSCPTSEDLASTRPKLSMESAIPAANNINDLDDDVTNTRVQHDMHHSVTTQSGDFREAEVGVRGPTAGKAASLPRVHSLPNLAAKQVPVRPKFFNSGGRMKNLSRASVEKMKRVQLKQLTMFREYAEKAAWAAIHTGHFDWFMYPVEDGSKYQYNVLEGDVAELKADHEWYSRYLESVELVAKAWGWDVRSGCECHPMEPGMGWTRWDVRLAKIVRSLWLFEEYEFMESMQTFARRIKPEGGFNYGSINLDEILFMTRED